MSTTRLSRLAGVVVLGLIWAACGGGEAGGDEAAASEDMPAASAGEAGEGGGGMQDMQLPEGVTQAMVDQGRELFNGSGTCFACHGQGGPGTTLGPNLTDDEWIHIQGDVTVDALVQQINTGVAEPEQFPGVMLPRAGANLTDEQVRSIAAYVYTLSHGG